MIYCLSLCLSQGLLLSDFSSFPPLLKDLREQLLHFMKEDIFPNESTLQDHQLSDKRWKPHPLIETLKVLLKPKS